MQEVRTQDATMVPYPSASTPQSRTDPHIGVNTPVGPIGKRTDLTSFVPRGKNSALRRGNQAVAVDERESAVNKASISTRIRRLLLRATFGAAGDGKDTMINMWPRTVRPGWRWTLSAVSKLTSKNVSCLGDITLSHHVEDFHRAAMRHTVADEN